MRTLSTEIEGRLPNPIFGDRQLSASQSQGSCKCEGISDSAEPKFEDPHPIPGRFFIRMGSLKELLLPVRLEDELKLNCAIDNGIHCISTAWKPAFFGSRIDQEFEL